MSGARLSLGDLAEHSGLTAEQVAALATELLQPCHAAFDRGPGLREGAVDTAPRGSELPAGRSFEAGGDPGAGARVGAIGEDRDALTLADPDDAVGAGGGQAVGAARQRGRESQQPAVGIGDDLDVHAVPAVLGRVVRLAVADAVALSEVPFSRTNSGSCSRRVLSRPGARSASRSVTAATYA